MSKETKAILKRLDRIEKYLVPCAVVGTGKTYTFTGKVDLARRHEIGDDFLFDADGREFKSDG